jgi:hypothetical protein
MEHRCRCTRRRVWSQKQSMEIFYNLPINRNYKLQILKVFILVTVEFAIWWLEMRFVIRPYLFVCFFFLSLLSVRPDYWNLITYQEKTNKTLKSYNEYEARFTLLGTWSNP